MLSRKLTFTVSLLFIILGMGMLFSWLWGWYLHDAPSSLNGMLLCSVSGLLIGALGIALSAFQKPTRPSNPHQALREGYLTVFCAWSASLLFCALPFWICGNFRFADAFFEAASGLSTTGSTVIGADLILRDGTTLAGCLEALSKALLFWRALLNWFGGIGFVIVALMFLPPLSGGKQLYNAEVPGLKSIYDQATSRIVSTGRLTLSVYLLWTALVGLAYYFCGIKNPFDATCFAFSTVATGGFANYTDSFGHYSSPLLQWIAIVAMFLSACNFTLGIRLFTQGRFTLHRDEEFRAFLAVVLFCSLLFAGQLFFGDYASPVYTDGTPIPHTAEACIRTATFQVVSVITTTGFSTSDYLGWCLPGLPMVILLIMFCGGCGGSTAGGMKMVRIILIVKQTIGEIRRRVFPHLMPNVMLNHGRLEEAAVHQTIGFLVIYLFTAALCAFLLPYLSPMDFETAISASVSAISNVGPALGKLGPSATYACLSAPAKLLLAFVMIAGRLELYTAIVVLLPSFWRKRASSRL